MIVKDEAINMPAIFESVRGFVDYYVIVDTGSTDGTQQVIEKYTKGWLEGQVHNRPWQDFSTNRNQALDLARAAGAKWALIMDADDELRGDKQLDLIAGHTYFLSRQMGELKWQVPNLVWLQDDWQWRFPIHEVLIASKFLKHDISTMYIACNVRNGSRSNNPNKLILDIEFLKLITETDPNEPRNFFYLGYSYAVAGMADEAIATFQKRIDLGGWAEELYISNFMIAKIKHARGESMDEILKYLIAATNHNPLRAEALYAIANLYRIKANSYQTAYPFAKMAAAKTLQPDFLFSDTTAYEYSSLFELMLAAHYTNRQKEAEEISDKLAAKIHNLPEMEREVINKEIQNIKRKVPSWYQQTQIKK